MVTQMVEITKNFKIKQETNSNKQKYMIHDNCKGMFFIEAKQSGTAGKVYHWGGLPYTYIYICLVGLLRDAFFLSKKKSNHSTIHFYLNFTMVL